MKKLLPLFVITILLLTSSPVKADIAPPAMPPGANLEPGSETTEVRMVAETVLIEVLRETPEDSLGRAQVTADFTMRNLGTKSESMAARFPISAFDGWNNVVEISNLKVQVDGNTTPTRRIEGEDPYYGTDPVPWAEFDVTFPPGQDVPIRVTYALEGMGEYPFVSFNYLLTTGAGWKDTIGSADLIVRLPYDANNMNVILEDQIGWSMTTPGASMSGRDVRWKLTDFEPTPENNLDIALVMPSVWFQVLNEQANIESDGEDGEAWGRLGKAYKEMTFLRKSMRADAGGKEAYDLGVEAYEECLRLLPEDAVWHAGYAELLYLHYILETNYQNPDDYADIVTALKHLNRALEINPKTTKALEVLEEMTYAVPGALEIDGDDYVMLFLTATPSPAQTLPTEQPPSAPTGKPIPTATSPAPVTETPQAPAGSGLCGAALFAPLAVVLPILLGRRKRAR